MRFVALQGRHDSRISVKFGTAKGTLPNSTLIREYLGFPAKKTKNCQNCPFFHPTGANPLLDVGEIVGFMWVIGLLQKLLVFKAIRLVNYEFLGQKTAMKHFPKNLRSPLAPKLLVQLKKIKGMQKWYEYLLSSCSSVEIRRYVTAVFVNMHFQRKKIRF